MPTRNDPRASVPFGRIGQRDPTGQIGLRLDIGVAIVLMPRERLLVLGLFVDRLVPVKAHVGTDQIVAQVRENRCRRELAQHLRAFYQVDREADSSGLRDKPPLTWGGAKRRFYLRFPRLDGFDGAS